MKIKRVCLTCNKVFYTYPSVLKKHGKGKYCSVKCRANAQTCEKIKCICQTCGNEFSVHPSRKKADPCEYCSNSCRGKAWLGKGNPTYTGKPYISTHGYMVFRPPEGGRPVLVHRYLMEQHLGRKLIPSEIIHHKNGIKADNAIDNLEIHTLASHTRLHIKLTKWSRKFDQCTQCHTTSIHYGGNGLCKKCYHREWRFARKTQLQ